MKIQEALAKVKELKTDAFSLLTEAQDKKEKIVYLEVADKYEDSDSFHVDDLLEDALSKLAYAHDLKLAIQKANALVGVTDLIQEKDFLKMVCSWTDPLTKINSKSDPTLENNYLRATTTAAVYIIKKATFNTDAVKSLHEKAVARIREIEIALQRKNWDVDIDEVLTDNFMKLLDKYTK